MDLIKTVAGSGFNVSDGFFRPANTTQYAANDAMGNSATAAQVVPLVFEVAREEKGSFGLSAVRLAKSGTSTTSAQFRLHLWTRVPIPAAGDNAAMTRPDAFNYLGYVDITCDQAFADGATGVASTARVINLGKGNTKVYGLVEALATYTPTSGERFEFTLEGIPD